MTILQLVRIITIYCLIFGITRITFDKHYRRSKISKKILIMILMFSIAIGVDYVLFEALTYVIDSFLRSDDLFALLFSNFCAANVFIIMQGIGGIMLLQSRPNYLPWIVVPMIYLFLIGFSGLIIPDGMSYFIGDTMRAVVMLIALLVFTKNNKQANIIK